jgi:hypothetical protein
MPIMESMRGLGTTGPCRKTVLRRLGAVLLRLSLREKEGGPWKATFSAQDQPVRRGSLIVRSIWAACLLIGGVNHARILLQHGLFWDYGGVAWASAVYWSSLTILDPLVAAILFARPKMGVLSTAALIVTNVIHNLAVTARYAPEGEFLTRAANPFIASQIGFMLFVGATARIAWKGTGSSRRRPASRTT